MALISKRFRVVRVSKITGNVLWSAAPEAGRRFWTFLGANAEAVRLRAIADSSALPYTYKVQKLR